MLTCSALKRAYRERLRAAAPGLRFVFLDISREQAQARVAARAAQHFFSTSLVDSQFATLEVAHRRSRACCASMRSNRWTSCRPKSRPGCNRKEQA